MTRGPSVPRLGGPLLPILMVFALNRASVLASFAPAASLDARVRDLVFVGTLISFLIGILPWPVLALFADRLRAPRLRHWLAFWGAFVLASWGASLFLKHWIQGLLGPGFVMPRFWLVPMFIVLVCLAFCEMFQAHADRVHEAKRLIDRIMATYERVREAQGAEGQKLRKTLLSRVEEGLQEQRQEVLALRSPAPDEEARLSALRDRVDALRETDLREASHLLHPDVPKVGLTPALSHLAERFRDRLIITVQVPETAEARMEDMLAPLCHAAYCLTEATLERASVACGALAAEVRVDLVARSQLALEIVHDCCGCIDQVADSGFDLATARLELAGGLVTDTRAGGRARIAMALPVLH